MTAPPQIAKPVVGTLVAAEPALLIIQTSKERISVPRLQIQKLEVSEARSSKRKGVLIGGSIGLAIPLALLLALCTSDFGCVGLDADRTAAFLIGPAAVGALIGAGTASSERWVELRAANTSVARPRGEPGLRLALTFSF